MRYSVHSTIPRMLRILILLGLLSSGVDPTSASKLYEPHAGGPFPTYFINASDKPVSLVVEGHDQVVILEPRTSKFGADVEGVWAQCSPGRYRCTLINGRWVRVYKLGGGLTSSATFTAYNAEGRDSGEIILTGTSYCSPLDCAWIVPPPPTVWPVPQNDIPYTLASCATHEPGGTLDPEHVEPCPPPLRDSPPTPSVTDTPTGGGGSGSVTLISAWPQGASLNPGQSFNPDVTVQTNGFSLNCAQDFLENRDGNTFGTHTIQGCVSLGNNQYRVYFNQPMQAPTSSGEYHSRWRIWHYPNHVGPEIDIWFRVGTSGGGVSVVSAWPQGATLNSGQSFNPEVVVETSGFSLNCSQDFLENIDGNRYGTWPTQGCVSQGGNRYRIYFNTPMQAPGNGEYHSKWRIWHYPNHVGPEIDLWFRVGSSATSTPGANLCLPGRHQVSVFSNKNFYSPCVILDGRTYNTPQEFGEVGNDNMESIRVGADMQVTLCEHDSMQGTCETFLGDDPDLGNNSIGNNRVSSLRITTRECTPDANSVVIWENTGFVGRCVKLGIGEYPDPSSLGAMGNDTAESIKVGGNLTAILYEHAGFGGISETFGAGEDMNLGDNAIRGNQVSSVKVLGPTPTATVAPVEPTPPGGSAFSNYGDGRDGVMPASGNLLNFNQGLGYGTFNGNAGSTTVFVTDRNSIHRVNAGDYVLLHQTRGTGPTYWERNRAASDFTGSGTFVLQYPLQHTYATQGYASVAQIIRIPQFSDCSVTGAVSGPDWNGSYGGIIPVMCQNYLNVSGILSADYLGFHGGDSGNGYALDQWQGESVLSPGTQANHWYQTPNTWASDQGGGAADQIGGGGGGAGCANGSDGDHIGGSTWGKGGIGRCSGDGSTMSLGGGGGGGATSINPGTGYSQSGRGGGLLFLWTNLLTLTGSGRISANGQQAQGIMYDDGQNRRVTAGSGGGGQIYIRANAANVGAGGITSLGAAQLVPPAGGTGRFGGGAGGNGVIHAQVCAFSGSTLPSVNTLPVGCPTATPTRTAMTTSTPTATPTVTLTHTHTAVPTSTRTSTSTQTNISVPTATYTSTPSGTATATSSNTATTVGATSTAISTASATPNITGGAFAQLRPSSPLTVALGSPVTIELAIDAGSNTVVGQQSYLTFPSGSLKVVNPTQQGCIAASTVESDTSVFEVALQNTVNNDTGEIAYASGTFGSGTAPDSNFRVARITFCAHSLGDAVIRWQFSPPAPAGRDSRITGPNGQTVSNPALYRDYVVHVVPGSLVVHTTWQGRPAQPDLLQQLPITVTLRSATNTLYTFPNLTTDSNGSVTIPLGTLPHGVYSWWAKGPQYLANRGSVTLSGAVSTQLEAGQMRAGDANNDNLVDISDFVVLRGTFGKSTGTPGYDERADFNGDTTVDITDFTWLRGNFGSAGGPSLQPQKPDDPSNPTTPTATVSARQPVGPQRPQAADAYAHLGTTNIETTPGTKFTVDLGTNSGTNTVVGQQTYMTFTNSLLQVVDPNQPGCVPATTVQSDTGTFEVVLQNSVNNTTGEIAYASATFGSGAAPGTDFRVASIAFCATAPGTATLRFQFSSPDRVSRITDESSNQVANPALYVDRSVTVSGAATMTATSTTTSTKTPTPTQTGQQTAVNTATPTIVAASTSTGTPSAGSTGTPAPTSILTNTPTSVPNSATATVDPSSTACLLQFTDMPSDGPFYPYVRCLACRLILGGYSDNTFRPNNEVTRGQLSKIVSNASGFDEGVSGQLFEDIPADQPFYAWIQRLAARVYISGYPCGGEGEPCNASGHGDLPYFRPNANATRGQISKIVSNAAGFDDTSTGQSFEDVPDTSPFYEWVQRLTSRGIMGGYPCGGEGEPCNASGQGELPYFRPNSNATRGQTAKIVSNTFLPNCQTPVRR